MSGRRLALVVASAQYEHESLRQLRSPAADAAALATVLGDPEIADFEVTVLRDEPAHVVAGGIEDHFTDAKPEDLLLLHFSGHGLKDESGALHFAASNTRPTRLGSTAVAAEFVQRCMRSSRARRMVLFLDCCYGGAFAQGVAVRASGSVNVLEAFPADRLGGGRGRAVISASSAMEYAFEASELADDHQQPSVFTSALVHGLRTGEADRDEDGLVSLNELYDYVFDKVREQNPNQTPTRDIELQGELYIARSNRRKVVAAALPRDLADALADPNMFARLGAVGELKVRLGSADPSVALGAKLALEGLVTTDISYVATAAAEALAAQQTAAPSQSVVPVAMPAAFAEPVQTPPPLPTDVPDATEAEPQQQTEPTVAVGPGAPAAEPQQVLEPAELLAATAAVPESERLSPERQDVLEQGPTAIGLGAKAAVAESGPADPAEREPSVAPADVARPGVVSAGAWLSIGGGGLVLFALTQPFLNGAPPFWVYGLGIDAFLVLLGLLGVLAGVWALSRPWTDDVRLGLVAGNGLTATFTLFKLQGFTSGGEDVGAGLVMSVLAAALLVAAGVCAAVALRGLGARLTLPRTRDELAWLALGLALLLATLLAFQSIDGDTRHIVTQLGAGGMTVIVVAVSVCLWPATIGSGILLGWGVTGFALAVGVLLDTDDAGTNDQARLLGTAVAMAALAVVGVLRGRREAGSTPAGEHGAPVGGQRPVGPDSITSATAGPVAAVGGWTAVVAGALLLVSLPLTWQYGESFFLKRTDLVVAVPLLALCGIAGGWLAQRQGLRQAMGCGAVLACALMAPWALSTMLGENYQEGGYEGEPGYEVARIALILLMLGGAAVGIAVIRSGLGAVGAAVDASWVARLVAGLTATAGLAFVLQALLVLTDNSWWRAESLWVGAVALFIAGVVPRLRSEEFSFGLVGAELLLVFGVAIKEIVVLPPAEHTTTYAWLAAAAAVAGLLTLAVGRGRLRR